MIDLTLNIKRINEYKNKSTNIALEIQSQTTLLSKSIKTLVEACADYDNLRQKENPYIVKRVISYMANGLNPQNAILAVAEELDEPSQR